MQATIWLIVGVLIALTSGWLLARGILVSIGQLVRGARTLAQGELGHRLEVRESDELGELAQAFNQMAAELQGRDQEVRDWNEELKARVKERTRAIKVYHQHLLHAEKSAVMATLSAGVATEINNPLTAVLGAIQLLRTRARQDANRGEEYRLLTNAESGTNQIRQLVKRVQDLSQRQPHSQLRPIQVRDLVDSSVAGLRHALQEAEIELVVNYEPQLPNILGNFTQLEQALTQILSNAVVACVRDDGSSHGAEPEDERRNEHASSRSGARPTPVPVDEASTLKGRQAEAAQGSATSADIDTLATSECSNGSRRKRILIAAKATTQYMVDISVTDNGIGMPEADLNRVFEPFVTLGKGGGSGLGLAVAQRIVEEHDGTLWATLNDGKGCAFHIRVPQAK